MFALSACGGGSTSPSTPPGSAPLPAPIPPAPTYTIGGTVTGLSGTLVLQNNGGDDLTVTTNSAFTFATALASGAAYAATVKAQPSSPPQTCTIANASGTATANVSNVAITCANIPLVLSSSTPASGSTNVDRAVAPTLIFSRSIDAATATSANITLSSSGGSQPITIATSGTQVTISPSSLLSPSTLYTLTIGTGVHGASGELAASAASITFTTKAGTIGSPTLLESDNAGDASRPHIAIDGAGNAIAVWAQHDGTTSRIYYNRYTPAGGWGSATLIGPPVGGTSMTALNPRVAMNSAGHALIVWQQTDNMGTSGGVTTYNSRIWSVRYTPAGFDSPITLSVGQNCVNPQVATNDAGDIAVVWNQTAGSTPEVWARRYISGAWGVPMALQFDFSFAAITPQIALSSNGTATVVWQQSDGSRYHIWANRSSGTAWETAKWVENNSTLNSKFLNPQVATDANGNAIVAWNQVEATSDNSDIWVARYSGGGWGAPMLIENDSTHPATDARIAMDAAGNALVIWSQYSGLSADDDLMAARFTVAGGWSAPVPVETDAGDVDGPPQLAMTPNGIAQAVWTQFRDSTRYDVLTSRFDPSGGWSAPQLLGHSDADAGKSAYLPQVAINPSGAVQSVWLRTDGLRLNVWANGIQ